MKEEMVNSFTIRFTVRIRPNKYLLLELRSSEVWIFIFLIAISCVYYFGKVAETQKETSETEGKGESEEEIDKGTTTSETKATEHKEKESIQEYLPSSLHSDEDSPLPSTEGAIESPLLPPTEGATESSLTMAEGTVDNSLPISECIIDSSLTVTQGMLFVTISFVG